MYLTDEQTKTAIASLSQLLPNQSNEELFQIAGGDISETPPPSTHPHHRVNFSLPVDEDLTGVIPGLCTESEPEAGSPPSTPHRPATSDLIESPLSPLLTPAAQTIHFPTRTGSMGAAFI